MRKLSMEELEIVCGGGVLENLTEKQKEYLIRKYSLGNDYVVYRDEDEIDICKPNPRMAVITRYGVPYQADAMAPGEGLKMTRDESTGLNIPKYDNRLGYKVCVMGHRWR